MGILQEIGYLVFSYLSSVSIIFLNKYIYNDKMVAGTLLMSVHFITCFIVSYILYMMNNIFNSSSTSLSSELSKQQSEISSVSTSPKSAEIKQDSDSTGESSSDCNTCTTLFTLFNCKFMPFKDGILLSLNLSSALLFGNLSLIHNSISVYQLSKLMVIPCLLAINYLYFKIQMDKKIIFSLGFIVIGMILVIGFDIILNWVGTFISFFAIIAGATSQIAINHYCKKYDLNGFELLLNHSLFSSIFMALLSIPVDGLKSIIYSTNLFVQDPNFFMAVTLSGFAAFFVNVSGYLVIGKLSPLTFQVLGHAKTISVLIGGYFLFGNEKDLSINMLVGLSVALLGTFFYSYFKFVEETSKKQVESCKILENQFNKEESIQLELANKTLSFNYQPLDNRAMSISQPQNSSMTRFTIGEISSSSSDDDEDDEDSPLSNNEEADDGNDLKQSDSKRKFIREEIV